MGLINSMYFILIFKLLVKKMKLMNLLLIFYFVRFIYLIVFKIY